MKRKITRARLRRGPIAGAGAAAALLATPAATQAADFTVLNNDDSGAGSLRQAVLDANAAATDDRILFDSSVTGTIGLTTGELQIDLDQGSLEIVGPGENTLAVSGDTDSSGGPTPGDSRVFIAYGAGDLAISGLTVSGGYAEAFPAGSPGKYLRNPGGGLLFGGGNLTITAATFIGNTASDAGGAISARGAVALSDVTIEDNIATENGGGLYLYGSGSIEDSVITGNGSTENLPVKANSLKYNSYGGGALLVASDADFVITDTEISKNYSGTYNSYSNYGGLFAAALANQVTVTGSSITENYAGGFVGGIGGYADNVDAPAITLVDTDVSDNIALSGAGGAGGQISALRSTFTDNVVLEDFGAGGIALFPYGFQSEITDSTISGNTGGTNRGVGGIAVYSGAVIKGSTISGNTGPIGGVAGYSVGYPAAPAPRSATTLAYAENALNLTNSTVTGNSAVGANTDPGDRSGFGGGVYIKGNTAQILNSTIAGNTAEQAGGGIFSTAGPDEAGDNYYPTDRLIFSSVIADNTAGSFGPDIAADHSENPNAKFSVGFSLIETPGAVELTEGPNAPNLKGIDPGLGALADNGGETQTLLPADSSPVIDQGSSGDGNKDQRGGERTIDEAPDNADDGTDIGAVELDLVEPDTEVSGPVFSAKKKQKQKGKKVEVKSAFGADEGVTGLIKGKLQIKGAKNVKLKKVKKASPNAGETVNAKLKPKKQSDVKRVRKALKKGKKVTAKLKAKLTDGAGNVAKLKAKSKLK